LHLKKPRNLNLQIPKHNLLYLSQDLNLMVSPHARTEIRNYVLLLIIVCLFVFCLFVCLFVYLFICFFVCLFIHVFIFSYNIDQVFIFSAMISDFHHILYNDR
jgi:hypothetical protein